MASRGALPSMQEIQSMYLKGDIEGLKLLNEKLAKRANERLASMERSDYETAAYKKATYYINEVSDVASNNRFSRKKNIDIDDLYDQLKQERQFLASKTSTLSGENKRRDKIYTTLTENNIITPPAENEDAFKKKFLDFLDDDVWKEVKKTIYTPDILNEAGEALKAGASMEELQEAFNNYLEGTSDSDPISIWEDWISVK